MVRFNGEQIKLVVQGIPILIIEDLITEMLCNLPKIKMTKPLALKPIEIASLYI
jgi:hypothetical protein